jgi:phage gp29-like protein
MAIHYGFQPAEILWGQDGREVYVDEILPKDLRRFFFVAGDRGYRLRMHDAEKAQANGLVLPHRKFVVHRYASHPTEAPEGLGLGHRLFYPAWFKRQNIKFWLIFADKFASPTAIAKHGPGATADQKRELLEMLEALATDAGIVVSQDVMVEFIEAARSSTIAVYSELAKFCDEEMSKAVLGETGTTDQSGGGGSRARDEVANGIRLEIAKADADLLSGTLHRTLARWVTWFNFGDRAAVPNIWRRFPELEDKRDLNALAQRDQIIVTMSGRQLTEKYLKETYEVEFEDGPSAAEQAAAIDAPPDINALLSGGPDAAATDAPAATDTANPDPAAQFAEGDDISRIVDRVGTALAEERPIDAVYPELSIDSFAEDLAQRMAIEYLAGRYEVVQEIGDSPEFAEAVAVLEQLQPAAEFAEGDNIELAREVLEQLEPIDFAAKKKKGAGKNCKKGWSCGYSCISKTKNCRNALKGQAKTYADWLAGQSKGAKPPTETKPKSVGKPAPSIDGIGAIGAELGKFLDDFRDISSAETHAKIGRSKAKTIQPDNLIGLGDSKAIAKDLNAALNAIPDGGDRVKRLKQFVNDQQIKGVFNPGPPPPDIDSQLSAKSSLPVEAISSLKGAGGYTSPIYNHVVVSSGEKIKYDKDAIAADLDMVYSKVKSPLSERPFSGSTAGDPFYVYLHEMGHQLDNKSKAFDSANPIAPVVGMGKYQGAPTKYGATNRAELFAESFALYMLDAKRFKQHYPDLHNWVHEKLNWATTKG